MTQSNEKKNVVVTQEFIDKLIDKIGKILKNLHTLFEKDDEQQKLIEFLLNNDNKKQKTIELLLKKDNELQKAIELLLKKDNELQKAIELLGEKTHKKQEKTKFLLEEDNEQQAIKLLSEKVNLINSNFEELTKSIANGSYPIKLARSIRITESLIPPKIQAIEISKSQLIQTYNEIVALLSGYTIPVTLTPDSYRNLNQDSIILETTIKGNYWVVATLENKQHQYWLMPNSNINFNIHKLKTIAALFQLEGDYHLSTSEFILQEPAILSLLPNNKNWKLIKPGILFFGNNQQSQSSQLKRSENITSDKQSRINQQILSSLTTFEKTIAQINNKITQFETQSKFFQETHQKNQEEWLAEKKIINEQIKKIFAQSLLSNFINQDNLAEDFNSNINLQQNLSEADLALLQSFRSYFEKMADIVRRYHSDHHAPKEEADIIANYLLKTSNTINNIKTNSDLIKLFEYLLALKGKLSKYNHNKYKYRWSVNLENEILTKLQTVPILQKYQSNKLDQLIIKEALNRQMQTNYLKKS